MSLFIIDQPSAHLSSPLPTPSYMSRQSEEAIPLFNTSLTTANAITSLTLTEEAQSRLVALGTTPCIVIVTIGMFRVGKSTIMNAMNEVLMEEGVPCMDDTELIGHDTSIIHQPSSISRQSLSISHHPSSIIHHPSSIVRIDSTPPPPFPYQSSMPFATSDTSEAITKGIWMKIIHHLSHKTHHPSIILLDCEGTDSPDTPSSIDLVLSAIASTTATLLLYVASGNIQRNNLIFLNHLIELSQFLYSDGEDRKGEGEDGETSSSLDPTPSLSSPFLSSPLPFTFHWLHRDDPSTNGLTLSINHKKGVTPVDWVKHILSSHPSLHSFINSHSSMFHFFKSTTSGRQSSLNDSNDGDDIDYEILEDMKKLCSSIIHHPSSTMYHKSADTLLKLLQNCVSNISSIIQHPSSIIHQQSYLRESLISIAKEECTIIQSNLLQEYQSLMISYQTTCVKRFEGICEEWIQKRNVTRRNMGLEVPIEVPLDISLSLLPSLITSHHLISQRLLQQYTHIICNKGWKFLLKKTTESLSQRLNLLFFIEGYNRNDDEDDLDIYLKYATMFINSKSRICDVSFINYHPSSIIQHPSSACLWYQYRCLLKQKCVHILLQYYLLLNNNHNEIKQELKEEDDHVTENKTPMFLPPTLPLSSLITYLKHHLYSSQQSSYSTLSPCPPASTTNLLIPLSELYKQYEITSAFAILHRLMLLDSQATVESVITHHSSQINSTQKQNSQCIMLLHQQKMELFEALTETSQSIHSQVQHLLTLALKAESEAFQSKFSTVSQNLELRMSQYEGHYHQYLNQYAIMHQWVVLVVAMVVVMGGMVWVVGGSVGRGENRWWIGGGSDGWARAYI